MKFDNKQTQKDWDSFKCPRGWVEVFPSSPMHWAVYDIKDGRQKQGIGSRMIIFDKGLGHCIKKIGYKQISGGK